MEKNRINILDLFAGIGGFHLGLKQAGIKPSYSAFSEIDKHASCVYKKHFINSKALGDVKSITSVSGLLEGQKINLITFGFPCQDLSVAGNRKGLRGDKSSLFFEALRLIEELQPNFFIFENVKGFFSSDEGKDFITVLQTIANIGYDGQWQLVNTRWFLPQNRERIYFVGYPRGKCRKQIFPIRETEDIYNQESQSEKKTISPCLTTRGAKARRNPDYLWVVSPKRFENKRQNGSGFNDNNCFTLTTQDRHGIFINNDIRELTPTEWERLQGFPDGWTGGHSNVQRYKMLGNAVSVPVITEIINNIYNT